MIAMHAASRAILEFLMLLYVLRILCCWLRDTVTFVCAGDSGGPLVDETTGVLMGIVSRGAGCGLYRQPG